MSKTIDRTGQRFGMLVTVCKLPRDIKGVYRYECKCDCGRICRVITQLLLKGNTKSCGCFRTEKLRSAKKHGASVGGKVSPEYVVWGGMHGRCSNPNNPSYPDYGGRGITVCARWTGPDGFQNFLADMGVRPPKYSIERKDFNGNYCPENCTWIPIVRQASNRRNSVILKLDGESKNIADWARDTGIDYQTISKRLEYGWSVEDAIRRPANNANYTYKGVTKTLGEWAKEYGIPFQTLRARVRVYGWTIEQALGTPVLKRWNRRDPARNRKETKPDAPSPNPHP